ncbi:MAG: DNA-processing protein DprA [Acidimicrobiia bacterium]|nr:DNA-processing protein DprA [Acidimicrobiia bacterium]
MNPCGPGVGASGPAPVDVHVAAATLACLPEMTPARLRALVEEGPGPVAALRAVQRGATPPAGPREEPGRRALARAWREAADPERIGATLRRRGTRVLLAGEPAFPIPDDVPDRPCVLLAEGHDASALDGPRVAVVGTRAATVHGLADAREIGAFLARSGVTVVSGLAIGVDAAAHEGALDAGGRVVGVVATGLDVVYPRRHVVLFERVRRRGLLVGECGFGVRPDRGRFPVRNRIIAALADVVVVVEATARGGARITAERALDYGRPVLAVPGSRRNPAAAGCNALLADGAHPLLDPSDVLLALGLTPGSRRGWGEPQDPPPLVGDTARVHRALGGEPATADQLASRTGLDPGAVALAVAALEAANRVECERGLVWPR